MEIFQLFLHQKTHRARFNELRNANGGRVRAVRRAKSVVHINFSKLGERFGKCWVVRFFFGLKAKVLQKRDVAVLHRGDDLFRHFTNRVVTKDDGLID